MSGRRQHGVRRLSHPAVLACVVGVLVAAACGGSSPTIGFDSTVPDSSSSSDGSPAANTTPDLPAVSTTAATATEGVITVSVTSAGVPFDRRVLGTNVPAWLGPERLADATFQQSFEASGATVVRMPGGSWSSAYDWLACENGDADGCFFTAGARPTDFLQFMRDTGAEGMWTLNPNTTAQAAAAAVAFFNGSVDDTRVIGVDRDGADWKTVGTWAQLRADHGNPDPVPIRMWEVGNEVFGAKEGAVGDCLSFGWEDVWTCDGTAYIEGNDSHDGFLAFREAMQAVDPDIEVGAVGVADPASWGDFGTKVIAGAGSNMDFYIVHDYGWDTEVDFDEAVARPATVWQSAMAAITDSFGTTPVPPVAVTEYNLISAIDNDVEAQLTHVLNALYIADTIGQMAANGVQIANQWNFANGAAENGSDYGMINLESGDRYPQYYAIAMWSRFGDQLLPVASGFDAASTLASYASSDGDGGYTVLTINKSADPTDAVVRLGEATGSFDVTADVASAASEQDSTMSFNGVADPPLDLGSVAPLALGTAEGDFTHTFEPFSITVLHFTPAG